MAASGFTVFLTTWRNDSICLVDAVKETWITNYIPSPLLIGFRFILIIGFHGKDTTALIANNYRTGPDLATRGGYRRFYKNDFRPVIFITSCVAVLNAYICITDLFVLFYRQVCSTNDKEYNEELRKIREET